MGSDVKVAVDVKVGVKAIVEDNVNSRGYPSRVAACCKTLEAIADFDRHLFTRDHTISRSSTSMRAGHSTPEANAYYKTVLTGTLAKNAAKCRTYSKKRAKLVTSSSCRSCDVKYL